MSAEPDMLINQAKAAYDEAKSYRNSAEQKQYAGKVNIDNAIEKSEQCTQQGDEENAKYWMGQVDLIKDRMQSEVDDLLSRAQAKEQEARKYHDEARSVAEQERDDEKKKRWRHAIHLLDEATN